MKPPLTARTLRPPLPEPEQRSFSDEALLLTDAPVPSRPPPPPRIDPGALWMESVSDWAQLATLEEEWQALAEKAAEPNPFYEPWMLLPALRSFARPGCVQVLLAFAPSFSVQ